ncbi:MAG: hypothetical protein SNJ67_14690, partial [Chloracidobacterium sp.]
RMLAKRPEERPTAAEAAADLDRLADKVRCQRTLDFEPATTKPEDWDTLVEGRRRTINIRRDTAMDKNA